MREPIISIIIIINADIKVALSHCCCRATVQSQCHTIAESIDNTRQIIHQKLIKARLFLMSWILKFLIIWKLQNLTVITSFVLLCSL